MAPLDNFEDSKHLQSHKDVQDEEAQVGRRKEENPGEESNFLVK